MKAARVLCLTMAILFLGATVAVGASTITKQIEVNYVGLRLVVDGVEVTPTDALGNPVEPFVSEGTTYLPLRAVANALGEEVLWDGDTKTVYIGEIPGQETNWMKKLPPYSLTGPESFVADGSDHTKYITVSGVTHTEGVYAHMGGSYGTINAIWNTNTLYKSMTFTIGHEDTRRGNNNNGNYDVTINVFRGGEYYETYTVKWSDPPKTFTIDLDYCANLRLEMVSSSYGTTYGLYDISFAE